MSPVAGAVQIASGPPNPCCCTPGLTQVAHEAVRRAAALAASPLLLVDATAGNGHDTLFLAELVEGAANGGLVLAFDIQQESLGRVRRRLDEAGTATRVRLFQQGHEHLHACLERVAQEEGLSARPQAVLFNLGFLPGSDKAVATRRESSLAAFTASLAALALHGVIAVHMYTGHSGGLEECKALLEHAENLPWKDWRVLAVAQHNKPRNKEWLLVVERING